MLTTNVPVKVITVLNSQSVMLKDPEVFVTLEFNVKKMMIVVKEEPVI